VTAIDERRRALTKGERTRERLLRAAIDRFGSFGYRSTSVSQLSRDAGLTPAAAYAYFEDKETFWSAAIQADLDAVRLEVNNSVVHSERPIVDSVFALIDMLPRHALARRVMEEGSPHDLQMVLAHPLFAATTKGATKALIVRQAAGILPPNADPEQLALGIETVIFSFVLSVVRAGMMSSQERIGAVVATLQAAAGGQVTPDERRR